MDFELYKRIVNLRKYEKRAKFLYCLKINKNYIEGGTCKEILLSRCRDYSFQSIFLVAPLASIIEVLNCWKDNNLPKFDYEIIDEEHQGLCIEFQDVFASLIYLDVLVTLIKAAIRKNIHNKPLLDRINNTGSYSKLKDAVNFIVNSKKVDLSKSSLKSFFYSQSDSFSYLGLSRIFRSGKLQQIVKND